MNSSIINYSSVKEFAPRTINFNGRSIIVRAKVRYNDSCRNGHNTFSITGEYLDRTSQNWANSSGGCIHDEISAAFPELKKFIKWHLTSSDGPMHYVANSIYWAEQNNLAYARDSAVWPEAEISDFTKDKLLARLPDLLAAFKKDVEELGFIY